MNNLDFPVPENIQNLNFIHKKIQKENARNKRENSKLHQGLNSNNTIKTITLQKAATLNPLEKQSISPNNALSLQLTRFPLTYSPLIKTYHKNLLNKILTLTLLQHNSLMH